MVQGGTIVPTKGTRIGFYGAEPVLIGPDVLFMAWRIASSNADAAWKLIEDPQIFPVITARELAIFFGLWNGATDVDLRQQAEYWRLHLSTLVGVLRYRNKFSLTVPETVVRYRLTDARVTHALTLLAMQHYGITRYYTFARQSMLWLSKGTGIEVLIPPGGHEIQGTDEWTD